MSTQRGKMAVCDRCGEQIFLKELSVEEKDTDGGFTRWNEYKYEDLPEGWDLVFFGHDYNGYLLCPCCNETFNDVKSQFLAYEEEEDKETCACDSGPAPLQIIYLCDGHGCSKYREIECTRDSCQYTSNIEHAKNFKCIGENQYMEIEESE